MCAADLYDRMAEIDAEAEQAAQAAQNPEAGQLAWIHAVAAALAETLCDHPIILQSQTPP